jgi:hypothetical protein
MKNGTLILLLFIGCLSGIAQNYQMDWQQCFGGSEQDYATDIINVSGGYFIIGWTESSDGYISFNHGLNDGWLIRIDNTGNILWEKTYGGSNGDGFFRIVPDHLGNYIIIGGSGSSDGDISNDPYPGSEDFWIVKIDAEGNIIWDKIVGGNASDKIWTGSSTNDGGIIAIGQSYSDDGDVSISYGMGDTWVVKINTEGELEWDFTIGTDFIDVGQAIMQTSDGGYLVGGSSMLGEGGNITCEPHSSMADAILTKLNADRNIEWQHCYGGSEHDGIVSLIEIEDGYIFGAYTSSNDGDVSGWHSGYNHLGNPQPDMWIVKIDFSGNIIWQNALGGSNFETNYRIFEDSFNCIYSFGVTYSNDGDVSGNHSVSEYDSDIWVIELDSEGELISQQCFGGEGKEGIEHGIVFNDNYHFIVAGNTDYGPSYDVHCTPHGGNWSDLDFWIFEVKDTTVSVPEQPPQVSALITYPNPANNYVCFERKGKTNSHRIEINIFSASGIPVKELTLNPGETLKVWDTRSIPAGVYFYLSIRQDGAVEYGKVVVE